MNYPSLVSLREVAPRDGWQKFKTVLPTEVKRELICSMIDYGARELEIGVFSSDPVRGRQYQDLDSLCQMVLPYAAEKGVRVTALVESVEAARRASTLGIRHVDFFLSVSDTFGRGFGSTPVEAFATPSIPGASCGGFWSASGQSRSHCTSTTLRDLVLPTA